MGFWKELRKAGRLGRRLVERIDALDEKVRSEDLARRLAEGPGERELTGGVEALDEMPWAAEDRQTEEAAVHLERPREEPEPSVHDEVTEVRVREDDPERTLPLPRSDDPGEPPAEAEAGDLVIEGAGGAEPGPRFRNSLEFTDEEVETLLRVEHFPYLPAVPVETLHRLALVEEDLMARGVLLGHAWRDTWRQVVPREPLWEAAFWFTGAHHDARVLEALDVLERAWTDEASRALAWAVLPFGRELAGAVQAHGRDEDGAMADAMGLLLALESVEEALGRRRELVAGGPPELRAELDHLPVEPRGIFRFRGFHWLSW